MRMRKKPNLLPRMERCTAVLTREPETLRGGWLADFPGHDAL
jgi:tRNA (guanine-N7-)-methyltransferase